MPHKIAIPLKKLIMFQFDCSENLIFFAQRFYQSKLKYKIINELYIDNGKYRLIFHSPIKYVKKLLKFSDLADKITLLATDIAVTREHAKKISQNYSGEKIGKAFLNRL